MKFAVTAFASMFVLVSPITVAPIYAGLTRNLDKRRARSVAYRAVLTAAIVLLVMVLVGESVFAFFSISVDSLRVVGGVIFFLMGYDMLNSRLPRTKHADESEKEYAHDVAVAPLGIPLIAGPGAITTAIVLSNDAATLTDQFVLLGMIALVLAVTLTAFLGVERLNRWIGIDGQRITMRLVGLIEMAFAVEFLFQGLTPIIRRILA
ncbi:MAG: MarC family protein [Acidimicrobiia bacterium]|nr:MarC family protein [Acidimicrobiia bacterium]